jgi:hypothetical protein
MERDVVLSVQRTLSADVQSGRLLRWAASLHGARVCVVSRAYRAPGHSGASQVYPWGWTRRRMADGKLWFPTRWAHTCCAASTSPERPSMKCPRLTISRLSLMLQRHACTRT